ncbi:MAG: molybdopterin-dependent oxidoreductase [Oscillospiraceae bacterium]|nr:molybdopterin-dependent oxidoreductase [Oscillospiraceae bacterium]
MSERKTVKAACRSCHGGCSVLLTVEDGRVVKIRPDPDGPLNKGKMCIKGLRGMELLYHPDRLKYPMRRAGARGGCEWQRITWDEAYDEIAENLAKIKESWGAEAICVAQGTGRHMFHHVPRFANTLGTPNWIEPGFAQCFFPRVQVGMMCFGASPIADYYGEVKPACILVWGHNHEVSSAGSECQFLIGEAIAAGAKLITVDPRKTPSAKRSEHWLRLRPGTDAALALGMLHVILNEGIYDKDFVDKWCYGFEPLRQRVQQYPPERVAEITWVPAQQIIDAARMLATTRPATLEWGVGIEHTPNTTQTVRAVALLMAVTGNYDVPGGWLEDLGVLPAADHNNHLLSEEQGKKRLGESEYRILAGSHNPFPSAHIPSVIEAAISGQPYPIKSFLHFGNNGILSNADAHKTARALRAAEFNVCMDLFMTPTAQLCDIVLPAAAWMELDEIHCAPDWGHTILTQKQVVRTYECKSDEEVFCELSARMGLAYGAETPSDIYDEQLRRAAEQYPALEGIDFARMKQISYLQIPYTYKKYEQRGGFRTPTGKVELYSTIFEKLGYDPLPYYEEPPESPYSTPELLKAYPYVLTTGGRRPQYFCSEGRQMESFRRAHNFPQVEIHPQTAAAHGIENGDMVYISSPRGKIIQKAWVHDGIDPRVINCEYGWWFPEQAGPEHGCFTANCNVLTSMEAPFDPCMGTYQLRGLLCTIEKAMDYVPGDRTDVPPRGW